MSPAAYFYLDNDRAGSHVHLAALADTYDPFTRRRLCEAGVGAGTRLWEIGAGTGSVARWAADQGAVVLATDVKTQHITPHAGVTVLPHDVARDPIPAGPWHVIHVRLVLAHLPGRWDIVARLAAALAPGGALVIEEFAGSWADSVLAAPDLDEADRLFAAFHTAHQRVLVGCGVDLTWSRRAHAAMRAAGLQVETETWSRDWAGGSPGCLHPYHSVRQNRRRLIDAGMVAADLDAFGQLLLNPDVAAKNNVCVSHVGVTESA